MAIEVRASMQENENGSDREDWRTSENVLEGRAGPNGEAERNTASKSEREPTKESVTTSFIFSLTILSLPSILFSPGGRR